jgi:hypothetical protein
MKMKTTMSILSCSVLSLVAMASMRMSAATPSDNEVWTSARTNALGTGTIIGNGAITNPFYGDFDAIMLHMPVDCTIHLLPGVHFTKGWSSLGVI